MKKWAHIIKKNSELQESSMKTNSIKLYLLLKIFRD